MIKRDNNILNNIPKPKTNKHKEEQEKEIKENKDISTSKLSTLEQLKQRIENLKEEKKLRKELELLEKNNTFSNDTEILKNSEIIKDSKDEIINSIKPNNFSNNKHYKDLPDFPNEQFNNKVLEELKTTTPVNELKNIDVNKDFFGDDETLQNTLENDKSKENEELTPEELADIEREIDKVIPPEFNLKNINSEKDIERIAENEFKRKYGIEPPTKTFTIFI